ncbi:MAG: penicillin-binding protein 1A [Clostridia bacterium]|nr:penicillin-binding protein 1A [Clostridia bacterium]
MVKGRKQVLLIILLLSLVLINISGCMSVQKLPEPEIALASKVYDVNGKLITTLFEENRIKVGIDQISSYAIKAVVATEDARFYRHYGFDPVRIAGAAFRNLQAGEIKQGGSTITQQTAKNLYLTHERTFTRKIKEAILTIQLERKYTKDEILEMYLNQIYFGHGAYGIEVASRTFFNKPAKDLTLAESAMLIGIPARPSAYSPFRNFAAAQKRQAVVLNRMVEVGMITQEEADKAKNEKITLSSSKGLKEGNAPYFIDEIRQYISEKYDNGSELLLKGGLSIYTTLDIKTQKAAEKAFQQGLKDKNAALEGALVAIDPTNGYIKAMVGGRNFEKSKFNRALAKRQPGSAFKPFLYAAAIDKGYTAASLIRCEPVYYPQPGGQVYEPKDYGEQPYHYRDFTLKEALAVSDNIVAVRLNEQIGPKITVEYAQKMGITSPMRPYLSLALGTSEVSPLEMASAYGVLANQGISTKPLMIIKIVDPTGKVLEENEPSTKKIMEQSTAYIVTDMLKAVINPGGTAGRVAGIIQRPAAGKTGTSQNLQDAWFVGYTPKLVAAVYIGYDSPRSVGKTGGAIAAPIWASFVKDAMRGTAAQDFPLPINVEKTAVNLDTGNVASPWAYRTMEMAFVKGTLPPEDFSIIQPPFVPEEENTEDDSQEIPPSNIEGVPGPNPDQGTEEAPENADIGKPFWAR